MSTAKRGEWVQIETVILPVGERAPQVPDDTKQVPLMMWVKGFLDMDSCDIGAQAQIRTVNERRVSGKLKAILPTYEHNFGIPQPELMSIGLELKAMLRGGEQNG